jgi:PBP1b-binding outer membrane lipoprotein LpoB
MSLRLAATILTLGLAVIFSAGCANTVDPVYPVSTGSHSKIEQVSPDKPRKAVVWGNHPIVVNSVIQAMQETKVRVIERARLKEIMNEQKVRLTNTSDDEADLLRVGRLLGADWIIFADAAVHSAEDRRTSGDASGANSRAQPVYHLSVSLRNVSIETGEIRWSGTATYPAPVTNPDQALISLTRMAMSHAVCPLENGYTWDERAGCRKPK